MKYFHFNRLEKLAKHLDTGKLGHKVFDFSTWNTGLPPGKGNVCGTNGCAIGECPIVFSRQWHFKDHVPQLIGGCKHWYPGYHIDDFFGLQSNERHALFIPVHLTDDALRVGPLTQMGPKATRKQVARQIRRFITWKKEELSK